MDRQAAPPPPPQLLRRSAIARRAAARRRTEEVKAIKCTTSGSQLIRADYSIVSRHSSFIVICLL